jgi:hypothetical protein
MFLAVFIICEAAAKPMKKDGPENELASDEVEESQNFHDHHLVGPLHNGPTIWWEILVQGSAFLWIYE